MRFSAEVGHGDLTVGIFDEPGIAEDPEFLNESEFCRLFSSDSQNFVDSSLRESEFCRLFHSGVGIL